MKRRVTRRRILGLLAAGTAAAIGPVALGWRQILAQAGGVGSPTPSPTPRNQSASPASTPPPGSTVAGPAEEITFSGKVDRVLGPSEFVGSSRRFPGVTVDLSNVPSGKVYPNGHVPSADDIFYSRGHWLGTTGRSTWQVEFVDFNIYHIRGALSTAGLMAPGIDYSTVDAATNRAWQLVIKAANLTHFTIHQTAMTPTDALLAVPDGTGADIIGYEDRPARPGVLVATFLEVHPKAGS